MEMDEDPKRRSEVELPHLAISWFVVCADKSSSQADFGVFVAFSR